MAERVIPVWVQAAVLGILILLTAGTVAFSFAPVSGFWHRIVAASIAAVQVSLMVLFFMHGITSPKLTWCVISVAIFWLVAILFVLTFTDYATRAWFPHAPGH